MLSAGERRKLLRSQPVPGLQNRNTGDLQWEMRANYNARYCADERKAVGARTMVINEKTMRTTIGTMKNTGE
jgi:hypothetical protein